jgi:hypothetical protein
LHLIEHTSVMIVNRWLNAGQETQNQ